MNKPFGLLLISASLLLLPTACPGERAPVLPTPASPPTPTDDGPIRASKSGLGFRLTEEIASDTDRAKPVNAALLSEAEQKKLLSRLPPLPVDPDAQKDFALRAGSTPAPKVGKSVVEVFPPPVTTPAAATISGPLRVIRRAPEGAVPIAPHVTLTFSRPMVSVTSLAELAKLPPPATLSPQPPGAWRWLGTETAVFEPSGRMPMATQFTVEVPAGTRSASGEPLAEPARWSFSTPAPSVTEFFPKGGPQKRDPVFFVAFDQNVDAAAVLRNTKVTAGGKAFEVRAATDTDLDAAPDVVRKLEKADKARAFAFRPMNTLPPGTATSIVFAKGTPSTEGPRTSEKDQRFEIKTYGAMTVTGSRCGYQARCSPRDSLSIEFSNPIERSAFESSFVELRPEVPSLRVEAYGNAINISGAFRGRTKYTAKVSSRIKDAFGQTLGAEKEVTFDVGSADAELLPANDYSVVLDPSGRREVPILSINVPELHVRVYAVEPSDWPAYVAFANEGERSVNGRPTPAPPPGKLVFDASVRPRGNADEINTTVVDITKALTGGFGHAVVVADWAKSLTKRYGNQWFRTWVQSTKIGVAAYRDQDGFVAWTSALEDGSPLEGVEVTIDRGPSSKSDKEGLARLPHTSDARLLVARKGKDTAFVAEQGSWDGFFTRPRIEDDLHWVVFDDRGTYKPGEEAKIKGFVRAWDSKKGGDVVAIEASGEKSVSYRVQDPRGAEIARGEATLDEAGGFDFSVKLPGTANLGHAMVALDLANTSYRSHETIHMIRVEEFRKPEFEVKASASGAPFFVGGHGNVLVEAKYYAGGGLPNAPVNWTVTRENGHFTPPNRSEYSFGETREWWWESYGRRTPSRTSKPETLDGFTDPLGRHGLRVDFDSVTPSYPMSLRIQATVTDVNRQAWASSTTMLVHPADVYVGLRSERPFVKAGEAIALDTIVSDIDGALVAGHRVSVKSERLEWRQKGEGYVESATLTATCEVNSTKDVSRCNLATKEAGKYRIAAVVTDGRGRKSQTEIHLWVAGNERDSGDSLRAGTATLLPNKSEYKVGETAEVLVVSPFAPAEGVFTVRRQGIVKLERFSMKEKTTTIRIPIREEHLPLVGLHIDLVGSLGRETASGAIDSTAPKRPAFAVGAVDLKVPPVLRELTIGVSPTASSVEPGGKSVVRIDVKDNKGAAVANANLTVIVVDEAVLALSAYKTPNPLETFYARRPDGVGSRENRSLVSLVDVNELGRARGPGGGKDRSPRQTAAREYAQPMAAPMASAMGRMEPKAERQADRYTPEPTPNTPIRTRTNFEALAAFAPRVVTDGAGHAEVPVSLPDNLTRYRIMVVGTSGANRFGSGESTVTARLPITVKPSLPRFLNFGDSFDMALVIQNQTDAPLSVDVAARTSNASLTEGAGRRVTVPANDRVEVRMPAKAAKAGKARFQIAAAAGKWSDASLVEIPVWTPATTEAFATYGQIDSGAIAQSISMPSGVVKEFGGVDISTSSTAVAELTDAVLYLVKYPYDCSEQLASRILTIAALRDVLTAFQAEGMPNAETVKQAMRDDIEVLKRRQNSNGGFGFWATEPWPYVSVHVTHALQRAKGKGFDVPKPMLERALRYLVGIESHIPSWYSPESRRALVAYALYVRNRLGDSDRARAKRLIAESGGVEKTSLETLGWLLPMLSADTGSANEVRAIRKLLENRVEETAGNAHFTTSYSDGAYVLMHSDRRADGVLLEAMIGDQPTHAIIPKLVKGLLAHRTRGHWANTQESAFVLLALDKYFATYEKETPNFVARTWVGDRVAAEHSFKGRTTETSAVTIPLSFIASLARPSSIVVGKEGPGRLYYRIGMRYAPDDLTPKAISAGFTVQRGYEAVDSPNDVTQAKDGTWHVKAGAKVRVRLRMLAPARRYHVALVDGLPAGFEPMNAALAITGDIPADETRSARGGSPSDDHGFWWRPWFEHQNMRDERVEAFASLLRDGIHEFSYVARATTPGNFVAPPPKAEEMYAPETFGRGAGDRVVVE